MKSKCYTQIHEHELLWMAIVVLEFFIHKKLLNQQIRDMEQLKKKVRRIEQIKYKKEKNKKFDKNRKKKVV